MCAEILATPVTQLPRMEPLMKEGPSVSLSPSTVAGGRNHDDRTDAGLEKQE
jgi:hypothetical protein